MTTLEKQPDADKTKPRTDGKDEPVMILTETVRRNGDLHTAYICPRCRTYIYVTNMPKHEQFQYPECPYCKQKFTWEGSEND